MKFISIFSLLMLFNISFADTTNITAKATSKLASSCRIDVDDLNFGVIGNTVGESTPSTTNVNILCTRGTSYSVVVSLGTQGGGTSRVMKGISKGDTFSYSICQKEGWMYQQVNGTRCSVKAWYSDVPLTSTGTGINQIFTMYGYALNGYYTPDNYTDTASVTITY